MRGKGRGMAGKKMLVGLALILALMACNAPLAPTPSILPGAPTLEANGTPTAPAGNANVVSTLTPRPGLSSITPAAPLVHPQVSLRADLDYAAHRVHVQEIITYPNRTGVTLPSLAFDVLAARRPSVFTLASASVREDPAARVALEGAVLRVALGRPLAAGAAATVALDYALDLPPIPLGADGTTGTLGWSDHQTNLGDWFPAVSAYRDGWLAERNPPHVVGETTTPEAAHITVDLGVSGAPGELCIIASAPGQEAGGRYRFWLAGARSFALSLGTQFEIAEASTASGAMVRSAYFREHAAAGRAALQVAAAALDIYAARYGPYRYQQLAVVEADFSDGMEYSGFYFLGQDYYAGYDGTPRNYLTAIAAHEVAHQWWYDEVGNDQARQPWLDEAPCIYSELIYYEASHPDLVDWWWDFRVARFKPTGWVNSSVYDFDAFRPYVNAVYLRGALFLRDLRAAMGDAAFFDFWQRYRAAQSGRVATADDVWALLESYNTPGLAQLRAAYFAPE